MEFKIKSKFSLFNNFMKMQLDADIKHLYNRVNYSMINPIEMVPMIKSKNDHRTLPPISLLNVTARANVSTVVFNFNGRICQKLFFHPCSQNKTILYYYIQIYLHLGDKLTFQLNGNFKINCYKLQNLREEHLLQKFVIIHLNY